jgi:hypothetical protein
VAVGLVLSAVFGLPDAAYGVRGALGLVVLVRLIGKLPALVEYEPAEPGKDGRPRAGRGRVRDQLGAARLPSGARRSMARNLVGVAMTDTPAAPASVIWIAI